MPQCSYAHLRYVEGVRCAYIVAAIPSQHPMYPWQRQEVQDDSPCGVHVCPTHGVQVGADWYCVGHVPREEVSRL